MPLAGGPPAGWYLFDGHHRWWDGLGWGAYADEAGAPDASGGWPEDRGRAVSMACHLGVFVLPVLLALVLHRVSGRASTYVRHHATEAINFQLTMVLIGVANVLVETRMTSATAGVWIIAVVPVHLGIAASVIGFSIAATVAAHHGEWYRYPFALRLARGARQVP